MRPALLSMLRGKVRQRGIARPRVPAREAAEAGIRPDVA